MQVTIKNLEPEGTFLYFPIEFLWINLIIRKNVIAFVICRGHFFQPISHPGKEIPIVLGRKDHLGNTISKELFQVIISSSIIQLVFNQTAEIKIHGEIILRDVFHHIVECCTTEIFQTDNIHQLANFTIQFWVVNKYIFRCNAFTGDTLDDIITILAFDSKFINYIVFLQSIDDPIFYPVTIIRCG